MSEPRRWTLHEWGAAERSFGTAHPADDTCYCVGRPGRTSVEVMRVTEHEAAMAEERKGADRLEDLAETLMGEIEGNATGVGYKAEIAALRSLTEAEVCLEDFGPLNTTEILNWAIKAIPLVRVLANSTKFLASAKKEKEGSA